MSKGGRPKNYAYKCLIRILPETRVKILLLRPQLASVENPEEFRYGALSHYIEALIQKDLAAIEEKLR
ncbi:MAG: hypothetical protein DA330_00810 [Nitrososphaera sp.]|nr:hypothetical protein [Nitrososphaera sp.]